MTTWAIVPVKSLQHGKSRLASVLSAEDRALLTAKMLRHVVTTLQSISRIDEILVVSRDESIRQLAVELDTQLFAEEDPSSNLNAALAASAEMAWQKGVETLLIVPSDLGLIEAGDVRTILNQEGNVVLCPDTKFDGTNALLLRRLPGFRFRYGDESFMKHLEESARLGQTAQVVYADSIEFDLDTPADWQKYQAEMAAIISKQ